MSLSLENFKTLEARLSNVEAGVLSETEAEEVRLMLRRIRRVMIFFDGLGWLGSHMKGAAAWLAVVFAAYELIWKRIMQ